MQPAMASGDPTNVVGKRFLAGLIDLGPLFALSWIISTAMQVTYLPGPTTTRSSTDVGDSLTTLVGIVVFAYGLPLALGVVNSIVYRASTGASLGQRAVGLVTVTEEGRPLSAGACTGRFFLGVVDGFPWCCWLPLVGMITIGVAKGHRRVADMIVRSYVVPAEYAGIPLGPPANLVGGAGPWAQPVQPMAPGPPDQPQWDPARSTWVRWDPMSARWYGWQEATRTWLPLDDV